METSHAVAHKKPNYMAIWGVLLVLTIAEVGVAFFSHMPKWILIVLLLILALWKALLVALYYMHLKFDARLCSWVFLSGLGAAVATLIAMMAIHSSF